MLGENNRIFNVLVHSMKLNRIINLIKSRILGGNHEGRFNRRIEGII